jgi:hypothetical protein
VIHVAYGSKAQSIGLAVAAATKDRFKFSQFDACYAVMDQRSFGFIFRLSSLPKLGRPNAMHFEATRIDFVTPDSRTLMDEHGEEIIFNLLERSETHWRDVEETLQIYLGNPDWVEAAERLATT